MDKKNNLPKQVQGDYVHSILKSAAGAVPVAGSFLSELFLNVINPPYEKRKEEWMQAVADSIEELQAKITTFEASTLKDNNDFLDAMLVATKAAIATSSKDKHEQLVNALQNVALSMNTDRVTNVIFLNFIDRFTDMHICICRILEAPNKFRDVRGEFDTKETYRELINKQLPNMEADIIDIIVKELLDSGLINIGVPGLDNRPELRQEGRSCLTNLGSRFLQFITKSSLV